MRFRARSIGSACLVLLSFGIPIVANPQPAAAVTCGAGQGVTGSESGQPARFGVWVDSSVKGMNVSVASPSCTRVGSVTVQTSDIDAVELGWYLDPYPTGCTSSAQTQPHILIVKYYNGTEYCKNGTPILSQGYHDFQISNTNHDNDWDFYVDRTAYGSFNVRFSSGYVRSGAERHTTTDSALEDFNGLKYLGSAGGWNAWANNSSTGSSDGNFLYCYYSHLHTASKKTC